MLINKVRLNLIKNKKNLNLYYYIKKNNEKY